LRGEKKAFEDALVEIGAEREEAEAEELSEELARVPDLTKALRDASPEVQRQVFEAFELEILYDRGRAEDRDFGHRLGNRCQRFRKEESLRRRALLVLSDIAGAGFEPATFGL
jgi:hypothetical protein